jgi:hypothetical protein
MSFRGQVIPFKGIIRPTCCVCGTFRRRDETWIERCLQCASWIEAAELSEKIARLLRETR